MAMEAILALVRARTGLDFASYRRSTVTRRVRNRMIDAGADTFPAYLALLERSQAETQALIERLTIKVSRFYRNAPAFDLVREFVMPVLARRPAGGAIHVWSAGCGRGEEAHTLAMLLEERGLQGEVLATDIDATALAAAVGGTYPEAALGELPLDLRKRFLEPEPGPAGRWRVREAVRRRVSWRVDDLAMTGRPIERFGLVCCRNVLIYLDRATQRRALERIVSALEPQGYLLLGEAEWPSPELAPALSTLAARQRLFRAAPAQELAA